jgi:hypothetical protein
MLTVDVPTAPAIVAVHAAGSPACVAPGVVLCSTSELGMLSLSVPPVSVVVLVLFVNSKRM